MRVSSRKSLPTVAVSHDPTVGKRVFVPQGVIPALTQLAETELDPGGSTSVHRHLDMFEVFVFLHGSGYAIVAGERVQLGPGVCLMVEPNEDHELVNSGIEQLTFFYFGIAASGS